MSLTTTTEVVQQNSTAALELPISPGKIYRWALSPNARLPAAGLKSLFPIILVILISNIFNASPFAQVLFTWLNARYTPFQICFWGTFSLTTGVYWIGGLFYMVADLTGWPRTMQKWKIQPAKKVTWADYVKCGKVVLRNQICVVLPVIYVIARYRPVPTTLPLPGAGTTIWQYVYGMIIEELVYYHLHAAAHHPALYKYIHKKHHEFTAPVALAANYCTLLEHAIVDMLPILAGLPLMKAHISTIWMFFCSLQMGTLAQHSGYNMPFNCEALHHDWHHFFFRENYGHTGLLDYLHGTSKVFSEWMETLEKEWGWDSEAKARLMIAKWEEEKEAKRN